VCTPKQAAMALAWPPNLIGLELRTLSQPGAEGARARPGPRGDRLPAGRAPGRPARAGQAADQGAHPNLNLTCPPGPARVCRRRVRPWHAACRWRRRRTDALAHRACMSINACLAPTLLKSWGFAGAQLLEINLVTNPQARGLARRGAAARASNHGAPCGVVSRTARGSCQRAFEICAGAARSRRCERVSCWATHSAK